MLVTCSWLAYWLTSARLRLAAFEVIGAARPRTMSEERRGNMRTNLQSTTVVRSARLCPMSPARREFWRLW
jgi:hypothetical protein